MPSYRAPDVLFNGPPPSLLPNDESEREWVARGGPLTDEDDDRYYDLDRSDWDDRHSVADYLDEAKRGYARCQKEAESYAAEWQAKGLDIDAGSILGRLIDEADPIADEILEYSSARDSILRSLDGGRTIEPPPPLRDCNMQYAIEVLDGIAAALDKPSHAETVRRLERLAAEYPAADENSEEAQLIGWVEWLASSLSRALRHAADTRPQSELLRDLKSEIARRVRRYAATLKRPRALQLRRGHSRPCLGALRPDRAARPPPTPERCRPAVMLTGPPAARRHRSAHTPA